MCECAWSVRIIELGPNNCANQLSLLEKNGNDTMGTSSCIFYAKSSSRNDRSTAKYSSLYSRFRAVSARARDDTASGSLFLFEN